MTGASIMKLLLSILLYQLQEETAQKKYWAAYSDACIITFNANSEKCNTVSKMVAKKSQLGFSPVPVKNGFIFDGYYTAAEGGIRMSYTSTVSRSLTLYAHWVTTATITPKDTLLFNGRKYELYDNPMSWSDAKAMCESLGGHLVTITEDSEQAAIVKLIGKGMRGYYYIGYTDEVAEGSWKWVTGETGGYSNWNKQKSEGYDGSRDYCAILFDREKPSNEHNGIWVDLQNACEDNNDTHVSNSGFICEYEDVNLSTGVK